MFYLNVNAMIIKLSKSIVKHIWISKANIIYQKNIF